MKLTEAQIQAQIIDWLRIHGAVVTRVNSGSILQVGANGSTRRIKLADVGTADILALWPGGLYCAIEVKKPGNKPTPEQIDFLERVTEAGGLAVVAYSIEDVENALRERILQCQK